MLISRRLLPFLFVFMAACTTTGGMTVIPRAGGQPATASYQAGMGQLTVTIKLPTGETLNGDLIWIPPGGGTSTAIITTGQGAALGTGMSSGNTGMYIGTIAGDRGTTMRIELLCNVHTGRCVGGGQASNGTLYDIQK
jgi:hypothetical protein